MKSIRFNVFLFITILLSFPAWSQNSTTPTFSSSSIEELAWKFFVDLNRKNDKGQLIWESWKTQACINNPSDCPKRLHKSQLRATNHNDNPKRTGGCSPMTTKKSAPPSLKPFLPKNLSNKPVFCEEVTINPAEQAYAESKKLLTIVGQMQYLQLGNTIDFPWSAIEVKADWVPASSFTNVNFDCKKRSKLIYTEKINGVCYGLAGIHLNSKLFPNWLWATFEPQYKATNPNRCNPKLYNACVDPWGSKPAKSTGKATKPTAALQALFKSAGNSLDPAFQNYRLTGVQTEFNQPIHSRGVLGSSFVEYNAQVPAQQASCITCHSYAERNIKTGKTPPGGAPKGFPATGPRPPLSREFKTLDFSWFLGFGVPDK